jgi:hypothetical protein
LVWKAFLRGVDLSTMIALVDEEHRESFIEIRETRLGGD